MFRSLFGSKNDRPAPPKNQIEVVCPACGAAQFEPRLVVSTFCKKCGAHLTVHRKKVTASSVSRSGVGMPNPWDDKAKPTAPEPAVPPESSPAEAPELTAPVSPEEAAEGGFGVFLKQQAAAVEPPKATGLKAIVTRRPAEPSPAPASVAEAVPPSAPAPEPSAPVEPVAAESPAVPEPAEAETALPAAPTPTMPAAAAASEPATEAAMPEKRAQSNAPPPTLAPAPMTASTFQKMKDQGMYRNPYFKDAECFECGHVFKVSRSSRSAECPGCGSRIPMEDVEVNMPSTQIIKTRGDVLIRKRGAVTAASLRCKDLRCYGALDVAEIQAAGDAIFHSVGPVKGVLRCRRLLVEKGADVVFENEVYAEAMEIQAKVTGSLVCHGPLLIGANGSVNGDVAIRSISIEPGGELNGGMSILRAPAAAKPPAAEPDKPAS